MQPAKLAGPLPTRPRVGDEGERVQGERVRGESARFDLQVDRQIVRGRWKGLHVPSRTGPEAPHAPPGVPCPVPYLGSWQGADHHLHEGSTPSVPHGIAPEYRRFGQRSAVFT